MTKKVIVEVKNLTKSYLAGSKSISIVNNISFSIERGESVGLAGESGCGKSSLAKLIVGLIRATSGTIEIQGENLENLQRSRSQSWRKDIQLIFQHPALSLDPCMTVQKILEEPFVIHQSSDKSLRMQSIIKLLHDVGLSEKYLQRYPSQLSGGQMQRVAIARAIALEPKLLICDEPFSALDILIQTQITHLLLEIQKEKHLSYLIISHDLASLRYLTQRLIIMYLGEFVEYGPSEEVYKRPLHPYTQKLIASILPLVPSLSFKEEPEAEVQKNEEIQQSSEGCPFYHKCSLASTICKDVKPQLKEVKPNHFVACHYYADNQN